MQLHNQKFKMIKNGYDYEFERNELCTCEYCPEEITIGLANLMTPMSSSGF